MEEGRIGRHSRAHLNGTPLAAANERRPWRRRVFWTLLATSAAGYTAATLALVYSADRLSACLGAALGYVSMMYAARVYRGR